MSLNRPNRILLAPDRAPKRKFAANPPLPKHSGIAPNQHPMILNTPMKRPRVRPLICGIALFSVEEWYRFGGRKTTAMMELMSVRGTWPIPALRTPDLTSDPVGIYTCGRQIPNGEGISEVCKNAIIETVMPMMKYIRACGSRRTSAVA